MSDKAVRESIAAAVETVDDFTCSPWSRQITKPRDAHVYFVSTTRDETGFGFMDTWGVVAALPSNLRAAEEVMADTLDALLTALAPILIVTEANTVTLTLDSGQLPALTITGVRARD